MSLRSHCVLLAALYLSFGALAQAKHVVTFNDLDTFTSVSQLQLSPGGTKLAYTTHDATFSAVGKLWLVSTKAGSAPHEIDEGMIPTWSPNGRYLSYYSNRSGTLQLWAVNLQTNKTEQVTRVKGGIAADPLTRLMGSIYDPYRVSWSPDSTHVVFAALGPAAARSSHGSIKTPAILPVPRLSAPLVLTDWTPPDWTLSGIFTNGLATVRFKNGRVAFGANSSASSPVFNQLFLADVQHHSVRQLTQDTTGSFSPNWSPDGKNIAFVSNEGRPWGETPAAPTNVYVLNIQTGVRRALTHGNDAKTLPEWSPNGRSIAFWDGRGFGPWSVFIVPSRGGDAFDVTSRLDRGIQEFHWSADGKSLVVLYQDGATITISQLSVATGRFHVISGPESADRQSIAVSASGTLAWSEDTPSNPSSIRVVSAQGTPIDVINLNPEVSDWELGEQEVVRWKNHHGDTLEGVLIKPVGYQAGRRYPLIVDAYPGEVNSFKAYPMDGNQAWASMGYAVFWPDARAPHVWVNPTKGAAFDAAGKGPKGVDVMADDVMSGVDELIRDGIVDGGRMCLYGFSNGGGVVDQMITKSGRFSCAVSAAAALPDWPSVFFLAGYAKETSDLAGFTPWDNPYGYIALSPIYRLNRVTTPVLLADGDDDGPFLLGSIEMYNGLRFLGKNVTFVRYPNQGHGFTGDAMRDFWNREIAFFAHYLRPPSK